MKYSIRGNIRTTDSSLFVTEINKYTLWRLVTDSVIDGAHQVFSFEVWLNSEEDKNTLFYFLKTRLNEYSGEIDWHLCSHDEPDKAPCTIVETYAVGV